MEKNIEISTLNEYLVWIKSKQALEYRIEGSDKPFFEDIRKRLYFRGQSNKEWMITPALYRYHFKSEYEWLKAAEMRTWQETSHLSNLNKLITFQHYGLKTRLLDVTRNPLVALYFACFPPEQSTDGAVYYGHNDSDDTILAECLADILFSLLYEPHGSDLKKNIEEKIIERNIVAKENLPYLHDILCLPHFIEAPMNNPRLSAQQGSFIMAPLLTEQNGGMEKGEGQYWVHVQYPFEVGEQKGVYFKEDRAIIPANKKEDILRELDDVGINSATLFRDMEHTLMAVNEEMITGKM